MAGEPGDAAASTSGARHITPDRSLALYQTGCGKVVSLPCSATTYHKDMQHGAKSLHLPRVTHSPRMRKIQQHKAGTPMQQGLEITSTFRAFKASFTSLLVTRRRCACLANFDASCMPATPASLCALLLCTSRRC